MKLHLPVRLFRVLIALMLGVSAPMYATADVSLTPSLEVCDQITMDASGYKSLNDVGQFIDAPSLQLLNETLKEPITISERQTNGADYQYYEGVFFSDIQTRTSDREVCGGAVYVGSNSAIMLSNNRSVALSGNSAFASSYGRGGAIYGASKSTIALSDNESVTFIGNESSVGGAVYGDDDSTITLNNNGGVCFSGNTDGYTAGAIYTSGNLNIRNNDSVDFFQNAQVIARYTYRLRSIYADGGGCMISLSAAAGKSITFRDSIYIGSGSTFKLNEAYEGNAQQGDIIFTGATTIDDLYELKGNVAGTKEEIRLSRTSEVNTLTELYGGCLRVEEGATYKGYGITAMEGSAATVRVQNSTLSHEGYDLTFNAGTTLELAGNNTIAGNVQMLGGSSLVFDNTHGNGTTDIIGSLGLGADVSLALGNQAYGSNEVLLYVSDAVSGWDAANLTVQGNSYTTDSFTWVDNLLVLNYDESSFNRYFNGSVNYNERLEGDVIRHHYESVTFSGNTGNVIDGGSVTLSNNGSVTFNGNTASDSGGVILGATITLSNNGSVVFSENTASARGYAIYGYVDSTITLSNNGSVVFEGNTATASGVAIYGGWFSTITLSSNGSVVFEGNTSSGFGGAIYGGDASAIMLNNNGSVTFSGNTASSSDSYAYGGAIYGASSGYIFDVTTGSTMWVSGSTITVRDNDSVEFSGNTASGSANAYGGAIYGGEDTTITLSDNGSVSFSKNAVSSSSSAYGGAIYGDEGSTIKLSSNKMDLTFSGNTASGSTYAHGGAIYGGDASTITLDNNEDVTFSGNTVSGKYANGGAIYGDNSSITLSNNGSVTFSGNTARATSLHGGGAIYTAGDLSIRNNDSVEFYQNAEVMNGTYRLRSIYADYYSDVISLSAAAGKSITFRDSICICSSFKLNEAYEGKAQLGDIIFTGATTVDDLYTVKGNVAGTAEEIRLSRTSEVNTLTELYGGRLRVEEGAIYQGRGITAMEGSAATVRVQNAELSHSGYDLTFNAGTTLELAGNNTIAGSVQMLGGSSLVFDNTHGNGGTDIGGSIVFDDNVSLVLGNQTYGTNEVLLYVTDNVSGWDTVSLKVQGNSYAPDSFTWVGKLLVLNYDESSFNRYFNGVVNEHERLVGDVIRHHYESVTFSGNTGNVIDGGSVTLSNNGSVTFSGNTASSSGVAIHGSTITLSNNGSVSFSGNTASGGYANGGAIYGGGDITLNNNGSVEFSGNTASSSGGAICTSGNLSIRNNDSVEFYQNAEVTGGVYRLRSIYAGGSGDVISLSAAAGKSITFRDSIYIAGGRTFKLNQDYTYQDEDGVLVSVEQKGDIIFTGATTVDDLYTVKGDVAGTEEEIRLSRTTEVNTMSELYGGRLRVEEGAIYQGQGITAHEGSAATVRVQNATLSHSGYDLIFNAGTTLELVGESTVNGNLSLFNGSTLRLIGSNNTISGSASINGAVECVLSKEEKGIYQLAIISDATWEPSSVTISSSDGGNGLAVSSLVVDSQNNQVSMSYAVTDTVTWNNAIGDGMWNNSSANWTNQGFSFTDIQGVANVILGQSGQGAICVTGLVSVGSVRVEADSAYTLNIASNSSLMLTGNIDLEANAGLTVNGDLAASSLSLASGATLSIGGVLMTDEISFCGAVGGLNAAALGSESINFVLDRAALESLGIDYGESAALVSSGEKFSSEFIATLHDGTDEVQAAAYKYSIYTSDKVVLLKNEGYAYEGMQVWYRGGWVGDSAWTEEYNLYGFDSVNGIETVDLKGSWVQGDTLYVACEDGVEASRVLNGSMEFTFVDMGGGRLELGQGARLMAEELYGKGKALAVQTGAEMQVQDLTIGTLSLDGAATLKKATMNALSGIGGSLSIESGGVVTVKSAVESGLAIAGESGTLKVSGGLTAASLKIKSLTATSLNLTDACAANSIGSGLTLSGAATVAGSLSLNGALFADSVSTGGSLSAASLQTNSLSAASLTLTDSAAVSTVHSSVILAGAANVAGGLVVEGELSAASMQVGMLVATGELQLTGTNGTSVVSGDMSAASVSLASGATLEVGGTLTTTEVIFNEVATTISTGALGTDSLNFVLDGATLQNMNLGHKESIVLVDTESSLGDSFMALLNGNTTPVTLDAYNYAVSVNGSALKLTATYAYDGRQVWWQDAWVGESGWTDFCIVGLDAVDGVETVNLNASTVPGGILYVSGETGSRTQVLNGTLNFVTLELQGSCLELGSGTMANISVVNAAGETISVQSGASLNVDDSITVGILEMAGDVNVKNAQIETITGTEGTFSIESEGVVTVDSDVVLAGLRNNGSLNLGNHNLTVNDLVRYGGNVTADEVSVQSDGSRAASFDKLVADKVSVTNSNDGERYTDDLSVGDGSAIGELVAETLEVREGTVTLGRTSGSTEMSLLNLDLQEDATLVLNQQTTLEVTDTLTATKDATVQLKKDAAIGNGEISVGNKKDTTLSVNASQVMQSIESSDYSSLSGVNIAVNRSADSTVDFQLNNASIENKGSGTLTVTHEQNLLSGVHANGGDISLLNLAAATSIDVLEVASGKTVSAYVGSNTDPATASQSNVSVTGTALLSSSSTLNASLTLADGATLDMMSLDAGAVTINGALTFGGQVTLGEHLLAAVEGLTCWEPGLVLFTGLTDLVLPVAASALESDRVLASSMFSNVENPDLYVTYHVVDNVGSLMVMNVPEPTTTSLSLAALVALAMRRRRR